MRSDDPGAKLTAVPSAPPVRRSDGRIGGTEYILAGALKRRHVTRGPIAPADLSCAERRIGRPVFAAPPHQDCGLDVLPLQPLGNGRPSTTTLTHAGVGGVQMSMSALSTSPTTSYYYYDGPNAGRLAVTQPPRLVIVAGGQSQYGADPRHRCRRGRARRCRRSGEAESV